VGSRSFEALKKVLGGLTHQLVTIDKFTKWIEARPLANIISNQVVSFVQDIIFHFGVPNSIITDNGTWFTGDKFLDLCDYNNIQVDWTAVAHSHMNGQVERANRITTARMLWQPGSRLNRTDRILIPPRHTFFSESPTAKNPKVKHAWPGAILGWVTNWEVFSDVHK
jgi:hypothetical protein